MQAPGGLKSAAAAAATTADDDDFALDVLSQLQLMTAGATLAEQEPAFDLQASLAELSEDMPEFGAEASEDGLQGQLLGGFEQRSLYRGVLPGHNNKAAPSVGGCGGTEDRLSSPLSALSTLSTLSTLSVLAPGSTLGLTKPGTQDTAGSTAELQQALLAASASGLSAGRPAPQYPPGGFLEPCCHFFSKAAPDAIFHALMDILVVHGIDFDPCPETYYMACMAYRGGARVSFYIQVWEAPGPDCGGPFAVELQRRCGDIVHFSELYRLVYASMHSRGLVAAEALPVVLPGEEIAESTPCGGGAGVRPQPLRLDLPPPPQEEDEDRASLCRETLECLVSMARSDAVDMRCQALQALCELCDSADLNLQGLIVKGEALSMLVKALDCPDQDVHRPALTGIADLLAANVGNVAERLLAEGAICKLFKLSLSQVRQVARESARALAEVASHLDTKHLVSAVECFESCLTSLIQHCQLDPRADSFSRTLAAVTGFSRLLARK